jgi:hypothetical protein
MTVMTEGELGAEAGPGPEQLVARAVATRTTRDRADRPGGRRATTVTRPDANDRDE